MLRIDRRTIRLPTAAFTDLLSTGNLRVIQDREVRDAIVRFYEMAERSQTIIDKNNMTYVDGLAWDSFYRDGLVLGHRYGDMGLPFLEAASETVRSRLGSDGLQQVSFMRKANREVKTNRLFAAFKENINDCSGSNPAIRSNLPRTSVVGQ